MTKDETLDWLYRLRSNIGVYMPREWCMPMVRALDVAIKTLAQQSCDSVLSAKQINKLKNIPITVEPVLENGIRMENKSEMQKMIDEFEEKFYKSGLVDSFAEKVFKHGFMDGYEQGYKDAINRREPLIHEPMKGDKDADSN